MMKLIAVAAAALSLGSAGTAAAQTLSNSEKLAGGTWVCVALNDGMTVVSKQSYKAGGTSKMTVMVAGESEGIPVRIVAEGLGTWSFSGNSLDEQLSSMTATFADIGGEEALDIAQEMLDTTMVNVPLSNTATFDGPTVHMVDGDGVVTDCMR